MGKLFDDLSRIVASPIPRRQALRLIGSAIVGAAMAPFALADGGTPCKSPSTQNCRQGGGACGPPSQGKCCEPGFTCCGGTAASACCCGPGTICCGSKCCDAAKQKCVASACKAISTGSP